MFEPTQPTGASITWYVWVSYPWPRAKTAPDFMHDSLGFSMKWNYGMKWNQCRNFKQQISASCNHMVFSLPLLFNFRHVSQAKLGTVASFCLKQWWQWRLKSSIVLNGPHYQDLPKILQNKDLPKTNRFFKIASFFSTKSSRNASTKEGWPDTKKSDFLGQWRKGRFLFNSNSSWWMKHEERLFGRPSFFPFGKWIAFIGELWNFRDVISECYGLAI